MKRIIKKFENAMAAVAFAEAGEDNTARELLNEPIPSVTVSKDNKKESFTEKTMEAITFAEAGEHEHAKALMKGSKTEVPKEKLLVVGSEQGFSEKLVNHAINMAERMGYEIAALNVIPVGMRIFSVMKDNVKDELTGNTEKEAEAFSAKALEKRILFTHMVKFGDHEKIVREVSSECTETLFILTEPEDVSDDSKAAIPVYCIA